MKTARVRISRYRPHGSHLWVVCLETNQDKIKKSMKNRIDSVVEMHTDSCKVNGFVVMIWDNDGTSTCDAVNFEGNIPGILIPDFVRNRLLAQKIETWTLETLRDG